MFQMVIERLFLPELSKVDENDKKVCAIGVTHLLSDPSPMINGIYFGHLWLPLLQALLQLFESSNELQTMSAAERKKQASEEAEEELLVGLDDTPGKDNRYAHRKRERERKIKNVIHYVIHLHIDVIVRIILDYTPAFSCLAFAKKPHTDIFGTSIPDARCHLAKCLQSLTTAHPNQVCL